MANIRLFRLNNGAKIPSIGLGTWKADHGVVGDAITAAIKAGHRHIDCAQRSGNEKEGYSPVGSSSNLGSNVLKSPILNWVGEKLGKSRAQVALKWGLQMAHSVLPKSTNEKRIKENFDVFDWCIPLDLSEKFSEIEQMKLINGNTFLHETFGYYKTIQEQWDGEI